MKKLAQVFCFILGLGGGVAHAEEALVGPPVQEAPLTLREEAPPKVASASAPSSITLLKGLGVAGVAVLAFALFRRTRTNRGLVLSEVRVVARTSLGMRTELCLVEVAGERLLLGVTPTAVTTLSVLADAPTELADLGDVAPRREAQPSHEQPSSSLIRLLNNARKHTASTTGSSRMLTDEMDDEGVDLAPPSQRSSSPGRVEGQVRGLQRTRSRRAS